MCISTLKLLEVKTVHFRPQKIKEKSKANIHLSWEAIKFHEQFMETLVSFKNNSLLNIQYNIYFLNEPLFISLLIFKIFVIFFGDLLESITNR